VGLDGIIVELWLSFRDGLFLTDGETRIARGQLIFACACASAKIVRAKQLLTTSTCRIIFSSITKSPDQQPLGWTMRFLSPLRLAILFFSLYRSSCEVQRPEFLDYLDADTLEYYLSAPTADYDVAVMFYAQWCHNCHALAPIWDQIARHIHAGTTDSKIVMGLFDCESNSQHAQLCTQVGVTHYPTILFFSLSGQHFHHKAPRHSIKFSGNWKYGDAVLDWINTMSALSQWHRAGWGKRLRNMLFGKKKSAAEKTLPIGIPIAGSSGTSTILAAQLKQLHDDQEKLENVAVRSSVIVDTLLFPAKAKDSNETTLIMHNDGKNYTDVFAYMNQNQVWKSETASHKVLRTCVMEVALDYCGRLQNNLAEDWLGQFSNIQDITEQAWNSYQPQLQASIAQQEPFCVIVEDCVLSDFAAEQCRPSTCPFDDHTACRYLTSCFTEQLQHEYATAMNLDVSQPTETTKTSTTTVDDSKQKKKSSGAWGI